MANMTAQEYANTYTTFGGADITATFNGKVTLITELKKILSR